MKKDMKMHSGKILLICCLSVMIWGKVWAQPSIDLFCGTELNYRDILHNGRVYDVLVNLTPGVKWHIGKRWMAAAQAYIPVYNDYGDYYKRIRLNMAVLSKEVHIGNSGFIKVSGGWFGSERYGLDVKSMYIVNSWLALEAQAGWTGFCSMASGWRASTPERWTALTGVDFYLNQYDTQFRLRGGRYVYKDYGAQLEIMRHFKHCSVGVYAEYSNQWEENGGFKVVMMIPPYKRKHRKVNFRPASNFRLTNNFGAEPYALKMYNTDPEENEREGWFDRKAFQWGVNRMTMDFHDKEEIENEK